MVRRIPRRAKKRAEQRSLEIRLGGDNGSEVTFYITRISRQLFALVRAYRDASELHVRIAVAVNEDDAEAK